jgi:hypothetical protein
LLNILQDRYKRISPKDKEFKPQKYGGASHGLKTPPQNKKEAWLDAAYLEHVFPETRGQVSNLYIGVIGHSFALVHE